MVHNWIINYLILSYHLGLCCLPMSHKKDARLIRVNTKFPRVFEIGNICLTPTKRSNTSPPVHIVKSIRLLHGEGLDDA